MEIVERQREISAHHSFEADPILQGPGITEIRGKEGCVWLNPLYSGTQEVGSVTGFGCVRHKRENKVWIDSLHGVDLA